MKIKTKLYLFHFRSLKDLWKHLQREGINSEKLWESIKDVAVKSILW